MIQALGLGSDVLAISAMLLAVAGILAFLTLRYVAHRPTGLRRIEAWERLKQLADRAIETAQPIHIALGAGPWEGLPIAEALMGWTILGYIARRVATCAQEALVTTGDGVLWAGAQGIIHEARRHAGLEVSAALPEVRFAGPDPMAYAVGSAEAVRDQPCTAHFLGGHFGPEGLWLAQATAQSGAPRLGGTADAFTSALLYASLDEAVFGEDLFSAGAYLDRPHHLGSLLTQDLLRLVIIILIVGGTILASLGLWG